MEAVETFVKIKGRNGVTYEFNVAKMELTTKEAFKEKYKVMSGIYDLEQAWILILEKKEKLGLTGNKKHARPAPNKKVTTGTDTGAPDAGAEK